VLGLLIDAEAARRAHEAGLGFTARFELGGRSGISGRFPIEGDFTVERLGDGKFHLHRADVQRAFACSSVRWRCCAARRRPACASCSRRASARPPTRKCSPPRRRAAPQPHPGAEELGPLPRRLPADRQGNPGGEIARPRARRPGEFNWTRCARAFASGRSGPRTADSRQCSSAAAVHRPVGDRARDGSERSGASCAVPRVYASIEMRHTEEMVRRLSAAYGSDRRMAIREVLRSPSSYMPPVLYALANTLAEDDSKTRSSGTT